MMPFRLSESQERPSRKTRQLFLCHASEDKRNVVEPLVQALDDAGITYWYDRAEIRAGDSISDKIQEGLRESDYVLVIASEHLVSKKWARKELSSALAKEASNGRTIVLPLMVGDSDARARIVAALPLLADKALLFWDGRPAGIIGALADRLAH